MTRKLIIFISILIYGCNGTDINDKDKRNENWIYWIDAKTGNASWVQISGDENTLKDGRYIRFYTDGAIYQKGKLKNGKDIDTIYFYDLKEKLIQYLLVKPDTLLHYYIKNGPYTSYSQNGKIFEKGNIENHQIGNEWTKYFDNGKIDWTKKLINGTGWNYWYYKNGQISCINYHVKGKTNGEVKTWFENGQIKEISNWNNGIQNGLYESYYENGKPEERTNWVSDKAEGKSESWYDNDNRKNIKFFKADLIDGNYKQWYSNGKMQINANYSLGQKNGKVTLYYENGNLRTEQFYKNDQRNGICNWYDENGRLIKKENYVNGQLIAE
ncbi:toxin-antitoxin system YwqK family antitoxin [Flavobacterium sp.]|uniref:toxin-antitoxin system YwqK family antitoxin n=1 Tax=Flavobacterium sp. TaxID=239 RepID=UPI003D6BF979